jgi:hypothetical protein
MTSDKPIWPGAAKRPNMSYLAAAMSERRRAPRLELIVPVQIDAPEKKNRVGMACNASATGMLIGTQSRFQVGQWVELSFKPTLEAAWTRVRARIVRIEIDEARELFRRLIAVEFERPISVAA